MAVSNAELGNAVSAYVDQTYGKEQLNVGYFVVGLQIDGEQVHQLDWHREEVEPTEAELESALIASKWSDVREKRNALLAVTDFYALTDVPMSADMTTYRQALRDVPASVEDSKDVVWPEKPA